MAVRLLHWLPASCYAALIFIMSHQSDLPVPGRIPDYVGHFLEYAFFGLTLAWGVTSGFQRHFTLGGAAVTSSVAALYAVSDEFHQSFVPSRQASIADVVADILGALVCLGVIYAVAKGRSKARQAEESIRTEG